MASDASRRWRLDVASALEPRLLTLVVPAALLTSVLTRGPLDARGTLWWTLVNVVSLAVTGLWAAFLRVSLVGGRRQAPVHAAVVVLVGASVGFLKGFTTSVFGGVAGLVGDPVDAAERLRWISTTIQGAVLLTAAALTGAALARYRVEYGRLIVERARRELLDGRSAAGERGARVARFVAEARRRIDAAADPTVATVLEELVHERLRPLTRELWTASSEPTDFTLRSLVRAALHADAYPALPVTVMFAITSFAAQAAYAPLGRNILATALSSGAIVLLFALARRLRPPARWDVVHLLVTLSVVAVVLIAIEQTVVGAGASGIDVVTTGITVLVWLTFLTLMSSAVVIAVRTRGRVREELEQLLDGRFEEAVVEASRRLRDRETADLLHSGTQNRLIAAARRIERAGGSTEVVRAEVAAVGRLLDELAFGPESPSLPTREQVAALVARWDGFVAIETELDPLVDALPPALQDRVAQAVAEAVNNAVRHGRAERIDVRLRGETDALLLLVVEDDGVGPVQRPPGLGSGLFAALSQGEWSLAAREDGGSRLDVPIALDGL